jgi:hypothetical protein
MADEAVQENDGQARAAYEAYAKALGTDRARGSRTWDELPENRRDAWRAVAAAIGSGPAPGETSRLPLIGREYVLIEALAKQVLKGLPHGTWATKLWPTLNQRGFAFEVQIRDGDGEPTGRIARVQITLARVEPQGGGI